ncbi:hypothetical protein [Alienimonas californiensis]|uniref:hypothetical protein n=1 Tax=Alienimonas californiensis TaxID=2527989 RepID=UPI0011A76D12|nr:hypothetical protein [Alienimonas californiensis]
MLAGLAPFRLLRSDLFRRALRRALRLGLMLGPMIGPLASSAAGAELFPVDPWAAVADAATLEGWTGVGDAARWRRATGWAASGAEFASLSSAAEASAEAVAAADPAAAEPAPALLALAAPQLAPRSEPRDERAAAELDWVNSAGLAVHPVRTVALAATPRLPSLAPVVVVVEPPAPVRIAEGLPALAAPEPPPVFAALPTGAADGALGSEPGSEPAAVRVPLVASKPAAPAVRAARRADGTRLAARPASATQAVSDAVARFLAATAPGAWAGLGTEPAASDPTSAARTAGADGAAGALRR